MSSKNVFGLLEKIVTSTPNTVRALVIALLLIAAAAGSLWLLKADLTVGPVSVTGRETSEVTTPGGSCSAVPVLVSTAEAGCAGR